jgi:hypothetical protein
VNIDLIFDVNEVLAAVDYLRTIAADDEAAHSYEDGLRERVLWLIAHGHGRADSLASAALMTNSVEFSRWCA